MKFFAAATAFLACTVSLASAQTASPTYTPPSTVFALGEGEGDVVSAYYAEYNRFTLKFNDGTTTDRSQSFTSGFYDYDSCEGAAFVNEITDEVWGFASDGALVFSESSEGTSVSGSIPVHQFALDMSEVKNSNMYTETDSSGTIKFCVRSIIGTTDIPVNFIETQITVTIDLLANVVTDVFVQKRDPKNEDGFEETYTVNCFICDDSGVSGGKGSSATNQAYQGEMVRVCMTPEQPDVAIVSLKSFNWTMANSDQTGTNLQQVVVATAPDAAANPLSTEPDCDRTSPVVTEGVTCGFQSMMRASFYDGATFGEVNGEVVGKGQVLLALNRRNRRLNEIDVNDARTQRLLQGVGGDVSVRVPISSEDTGPGSLKTAGGASFGTAFASGIALLGAVLFA